MARGAALRQAKAVGGPAALVHQCDRLPAAIGGGREMTPGAEDQRRLVDGAENGVAVGRVANRIVRGEQCQGISCPSCKEIGDDEAGIAPVPRETDAAADCRVVAVLIRRRGIEHDEGAEAPAVAPVPLQAIAVGSNCRHSVLC